MAVMASGIAFMPVADAKTVTYVGVGEYRMGEGESTEIAKQRAKEYAEQNAIEQAGVLVESETRIINHVVASDEVRTIAMGVLRVVGQPVYKPMVDGNGFAMIAEVKAEVETEDIDKWFARDQQERNMLISQNNALQKAMEEQNRLINNLQNQLAVAKSEKEKENLRIEIKAADNSFLSVQKSNEGNKYVYNKDYNKAMICYSEAINLNNQNATAYYNRGVVYDELGKFSQAIADYTKAIAINPKFFEAYNNRGYAYDKLKDKTQAIADYTMAITINPQYSIAYYNRGMNYADLKNYSQAIADYTMAITINPQYSNAYYNRGNLYADLKNYQQAIYDYTQAIAINPKDFEAYFNRGVAYLKMTDYDYQKGVDDLSRAIEINPQFARAYAARGVAYMLLKNYQKAIVDFTFSIAIEPNTANVYNLRGACYKELGNTTKANADFAKAKALGLPEVSFD